MSVTKEDIASVISTGKELTSVAITAVTLINASALGGPEKAAAVQKIANGVLDAVGAIAQLGVQYANGQVRVPEIAELQAQITALREFKDLLTE